MLQQKVLQNVYYEKTMHGFPFFCTKISLFLNFIFHELLEILSRSEAYTSLTFDILQ